MVALEWKFPKQMDYFWFDNEFTMEIPLKNGCFFWFTMIY